MNNIISVRGIIRYNFEVTETNRQLNPKFRALAGPKLYAVACPDEEFEVRLERSTRLHEVDYLTMDLDGQFIWFASARESL